MGTKALSSSLQHGGLLRAQTGVTCSLLWSDLAVRTVDFVPGLGGGRSLAGGIAFVDYGAVEDVSSERQVELVRAVVLEAEGFH